VQECPLWFLTVSGIFDIVKRVEGEMKTRESGMPEEKMWHTFFSPREILLALGLHEGMLDVAEFGCGYGTFTIPAAQIVKGTVHAYDIEADMIASTGAKAEQFNLSSIRLHQRDFVSDGTGLPDASTDYVMMFNILHAEEPEILLAEAFRILRGGGILGIMHWNHDPTTPRGPSMDIRPKPQQCREWGENAGFVVVQPRIDLPPYHYGIIAKKKPNS
jgi:ubiquinone/menaquinone biosynthesis C-methylase UbiE